MAEYARGLGADLSFQAIDRAPTDLSGHYAAPGGAVLLAQALMDWGLRAGYSCILLGTLDEL